MAETRYYGTSTIASATFFCVLNRCRTYASHSFQLSRLPPSSTYSSCSLVPQSPGMPRPSADMRIPLTIACSYHLQTFLFALLLCLLTYFPTAYVLGPPSIAMFKDANTNVVLRFTWVRIFAEFKQVHAALSSLTSTNAGLGREQTPNEPSCIPWLVLWSAHGAE